MSAVTQSQITQYKSQCKELLLQGLNAHRVSLIVGCSPISVKKWFPELAVKNSKKTLTEEQQKQIIELRKQHKSYVEIGLLLNIPRDKVCRFCNKNPELKVTKEEHTSFGRLTKEEVIKRLADKNYEYISGYVDYNSIITLKCNICGTVFSKKADYIVRVNNTLSHCPHCNKLKKEQRHKASLERQEQQKIIRQQERQQKALEKQKRDEELNPIKNLLYLLKHIKECRYCGKKFISEGLNIYFCSDECKEQQKRQQQRQYEYNSRIKQQYKELDRIDDYIDKDISLDKVMKRDKGICYLCHNPVNINDYYTVKGTIVCGNSYPSIDHIQPISKGGKHIWNNVALAHRNCNSSKSNKII